MDLWILRGSSPPQSLGLIDPRAGMRAGGVRGVVALSHRHRYYGLLVHAQCVMKRP